MKIEDFNIFQKKLISFNGVMVPTESKQGQVAFATTNQIELPLFVLPCPNLDRTNYIRLKRRP